MAYIDTQHRELIVTLSITTLCRYAESRVLFIVMLNVVMHSVMVALSRKIIVRGFVNS